MAETQSCPQCGAELSGGGTDLYCPACLMKLGFESCAGQAPGSQSAPTQPYSSRREAPAVEELAPRFPQFELLSLVGIGGMGAVYKARQVSLDRIVAVKIIHREAAGQPGFSERFAREARAMARMNHANIVIIHDFGSVPPAATHTESTESIEQPLYFLVMEYVEGTNIRDLLRHKRLTPEQALAIVPPICDALQYAHDQGIVHRDIKPENILIDTKGRVKIADFGLAKLLGRSPRDVTLTEAHHAMGTAHYMAPEQLERPLEVDHRADIYALGVTFYEMLTGELPIGRFAPPSQKVHIDVRLDDIVLRTLEKEPARRYQHASEVKTAVESCVTEPARASSMDTSSRAVQAVSRRLRAPAYGMIAYGAIALVMVALYILSSMIKWQIEGFDAMFHEVRSLGPIVLTGWALTVPIGILAIIAGMRLPECRSRGLIVLASILTMLPFTPVMFGFPIGIWVLIVLNQFDVRSAFMQVTEAESERARRMARVSHQRFVFSPGDAPKMLILTLSFVGSLLLALAGVGLIGYSTTVDTLRNAERWTWFFGGGIGALIAGIGALLACWNQFRVMRGQLDWMREPRWNAYDTFLLVYGLAGVACLVSVTLWWSSLNFWPRIATLVFGAVVALQGLGMSVWRIAMRRATSEESSQPALTLQMVLVAAGMLTCALLAVSGIALLVYSITSLPVGSLKFWGGIGSGMSWLFGGSGGLLITWNLYRSLEGLPNWMTERQVNTLDYGMIAAAGLGMLIMLAGLVVSPSVTTTSVYALELIGGILALVAGLFLVGRALMRRAAAQEAESGRIRQLH